MTALSTDKNSIVAKEPVLVGAFVAWLLSVAGTFILGHTDLVSSDSWSALSTVLTPVITAVLLGAIAWVVRNVVTPFWKKFSTVTGAVHIPEELVIQFVLHASAQEIADLRAKYPQLGKIIDDILAHQAPPTV